MFCFTSSHTRSGTSCIWLLASEPTVTSSGLANNTTEGVTDSPRSLLMTTG
jgi:hypothetical protein